MKKKIGIIGQFPQPIHGLSKALDTLYNSYLNQEFDFTKINISDNKNFLNNLFKIMFSKLDLYYLTISQSRFGNIRDLIIIKLVQMKKRKIIIHLHGGGFREVLDKEFGYIQQKINYKILSKVDAGIVLGDSLKYIFKGIIPENKIYVVKNCVDDQFIISDEEFKEKIFTLETKKEFKVLYLSNFIEDKGYKEVLQLARLVKEKNDNRFKFVFAGNFFNDNDKEEFFDYIIKNNLHCIVDYKGVVIGEYKLDLLRQCDFFILLTRYKNEGQPISIIEAAINGLKVVSTNHSGIKDILSDGEMLAFNKNNLDIGEIYDQLINNISYKKIKLLEQNRDKMLSDFSQQKYLKTLKLILKEI